MQHIVSNLSAVKRPDDRALTDIYDTTKDIKKTQAAAGHTTAAMTLKHYVKGRNPNLNTAEPVSARYGLSNA